MLSRVDPGWGGRGHASLLLIGLGANPLSNQKCRRHHAPGLGGARGNLKWLTGCWRILGWGPRRWGRNRSARAGRPRRSRRPWRKVSARPPARAASGRPCPRPSLGAFGPGGGGGCAPPGLRGPRGLGRASHPALRVRVGSRGCVRACPRGPPPRPELPEHRGQGPAQTQLQAWAQFRLRPAGRRQRFFFPVSEARSGFRFGPFRASMWWKNTGDFRPRLPRVHSPLAPLPLGNAVCSPPEAWGVG